MTVRHEFVAGRARLRPVTRRVGCRTGDRGAATVEFAIMVPALLLVAGLMLFAGRLATTQIAVRQWADSAARTASLARDASSARSQAQTVLEGDAGASGVRCRPTWNLRLDVSAFAAPLGQEGAVRASVTCRVPVADLLLPGVPGEIPIQGDSFSTLDRFRGRR